MAAEEWDKLAVLTRGIQKTAEENLNAKEHMSEEHTTGGSNSPSGFSDESCVDDPT